MYVSVKTCMQSHKEGRDAGFQKRTPGIAYGKPSRYVKAIGSDARGKIRRQPKFGSCLLLHAYFISTM